jgi:PhzF family phenazine biosynthesis protein
MESIDKIKVYKINSFAKTVGGGNGAGVVLDADGDVTAHTRNFAPLYGIPEESATGTSNGALACYLYSYNKITQKTAEHVVIEQGSSMNRPSEIIVELNIEGKMIVGVKVGGKAISYKEVGLDI